MNMTDIVDTVVYGTLGFFDAIKTFFNLLMNDLIMDDLLGKNGVIGYFIPALLIGSVPVALKLFFWIIECDFILNLLKFLLVIGLIAIIGVAIVWEIGVVLALIETIDIIPLIVAIALFGCLDAGAVGIIVFIVG